jgi:hypothetical protein
MYETSNSFCNFANAPKNKIVNNLSIVMNFLSLDISDSVNKTGRNFCVGNAVDTNSTKLSSAWNINSASRNQETRCRLC